MGCLKTHIEDIHGEWGGGKVGSVAINFNNYLKAGSGISRSKRVGKRLFVPTVGRSGVVDSFLVLQCGETVWKWHIEGEDWSSLWL